MNIDYKTGKLPPNFISLGFLFLAVGIWRIAVSDLKGIIFVVLSIVMLLFSSGIIIDTDRKMLKKYSGVLFIKSGEWQDIKQVSGLQIVKSKETQTMSVRAVSRSETNEVYKLYLNLPGRDILLMKGKKRRYI